MILVFNLDLGQQPSMNTATISSKVTLCLVNTLDKKREKSDSVAGIEGLCG
jgi:hypothetical protein